MSNINSLYKDNKTQNTLIISLFLRLLFTVLLILHIPFLFFTCKDGFLTMIDELLRGTITKKYEEGHSEKKSGEEEDKMSYHDMNDSLYYVAVTFLVGTITVASIKF